MAGSGGELEGAQLLLVTGLTLCFALVLVGSTLAPSRSQGFKPGYVSDINYTLANLEREFPLALEDTMATTQAQGVELEATLWQLFNATAQPFEKSLVARGLLLEIELERIVFTSADRYTLTWTYELADANGRTSLSTNASFQALYGEPWWDASFAQRLAVEVRLPDPTRPVPLTLEVNFTALLGQLGRSGSSFDPTSLRVVGQDLAANLTHELVTGFLPGVGYQAASNALGTVVWTSHPDHVRYYLYFDTTDHRPAERPLAKTGQLTVDQGTGRLSNAFLDWRLADNSHLRIRQFIAATGAQTGWAFNNSLENWTLEAVSVNTPAQVTLKLSHGQLVRRYTLWEDSPLVAWEDLSGGAGQSAGPLVKPFSQMLNGTQGAYNYVLLKRTGAYLAAAVPTAAGPGALNLTNGSAYQLLAANATTGYYLMDNRAPFAADDVEAYLENLQQVQVTGQVVQRLSG